MSPSDWFFMILMPVAASSHAYALWQCSLGGADLLPSVGWLAVFFAVWALRNYFLAGSKRERGMFTMGMVALGALVVAPFSPLAGHVLAIFGALTVLASYVFVVIFVIRVPNAKLASRFQKASDFWAVVFKTYMVAQGITWLVTLVMLVQAALAL